MPRKSGTSGSEGGRRKRTRSTGTSPASYLTFVTCSGTYGFGGAVASAVRPFAGLCMPVRKSGGGRSGVVPSEGALPGISGVSLDRSLPEQEVAPEDEPPHPGAGERRGRVLTGLAGRQRRVKNLRHRRVAGLRPVPAATA